MFFTAGTNNAKGFTLAEAMIATVVLGIAAAGVLMPFVAGASIRAEGQRLTLAAKLAADLMEEIISDPLNSKWISYNEPQGQVKDAAGNVFTDTVYSQYSRQAACVDGYVGEDNNPIFLIATVRVSYKGREIASISRLIAK